MNVKKAVIPAAGLGTRFLPATKAQPKEMFPIVDKPTIQYIVEEGVLNGITKILIITGRNKRAIEDHFDKSVELEMELERSNKKNALEKTQLGKNVEIQFTDALENYVNMKRYMLLIAHYVYTHVQMVI